MYSTTEVAEWLADHRATEFQVVAVQTVLSSLGRNGILADELLAVPTVTFGVYWCDYILRQHQIDREPKRQPVAALTKETVVRSVAVFEDCWSQTLRGSDWFNKLKARAVGSAQQLLAPLPECEPVRAAMLNELTDLLDDETKSSDLSLARQVGRELATYALMVAPYPPAAFERTLKRLLAQPALSVREAVRRTLLRDQRRHDVVLGVCGIKLPRKSMPALTARQIERVAVGRPPRWAKADGAQEWRAFTGVGIRQSDPPGFERAGAVNEWFLLRDISGVDSTDAAMKARVVLDEALGELMVAKPDVFPSIWVYALVQLRSAGAGNGPSRIALTSHSYETRGAIDRPWSPSMRYILAASANARRQPIPSLRASLAWSVLEALELSRPAIRADLVSTLALLTLRQTGLDAYSSFMDEARVRATESERSRKALTRLRAKRKRWSERLADLDSLPPARADELRRVGARETGAIDREERSLQAQLSAATQESDAWRARVAALPFIEKFDDLNTTMARRTWLLHHDLWEDFLGRLGSWGTGSSHELVLAAILRPATPLTRTKVEAAAELLSAAGAQREFVSRRNAIQLLLVQMYALRNLSQHSGEQVDFGAELLASGALLVLDGLLDVLAFWEVDLLDKTKTPSALVSTIAARAHDLLSSSRSRPVTLATA